MQFQTVRMDTQELSDMTYETRPGPDNQGVGGVNSHVILSHVSLVCYMNPITVVCKSGSHNVV